jgi:hypothetical protein
MDNMFVIGAKMKVIAEIPVSRNNDDITIKYNFFVIVYEIFSLLIRIVYDLLHYLYTKP